MGTCGLLGLVVADKPHATYCHLDGDPCELGQKIAEFIISLTPKECDKMAKLVQELTWIDLLDETSEPSKELQKRYIGLRYPFTLAERSHVHATQSSFSPSPEIDSGARYNWYKILKGIQGAPTLKAIKSGNLKHLVNYMEFRKYCCWSYFIDFEKRTLETWDSELLDEVDFGDLREIGATEYMEGVQRAHDEKDKQEEASSTFYDDDDDDDEWSTQI